MGMFPAFVRGFRPVCGRSLLRRGVDASRCGGVSFLRPPRRLDAAVKVSTVFLGVVAFSVRGPIPLLPLQISLSVLGSATVMHGVFSTLMVLQSGVAAGDRRRGSTHLLRRAGGGWGGRCPGADGRSFPVMRRVISQRATASYSL